MATIDEPTARPGLHLAPLSVTTSTYERLGKRVVDVVVAGGVAVAVAPVLLGTYLALRMTLGPGVVLHQDRIGRGGTTFSLLKFRTMEHCRRQDEGAHDDGDAWRGHDRRRTHKSDEDPRHTRLGRVIRKFSLDELPQLINVLRGDMSLVGPRPQLVSAADPEFRSHSRHRARPGLTGPFQTSALRGSGDLTLGLDVDAAYVADIRFRHDLRYLLRTVGSLLRGTGS